MLGFWGWVWKGQLWRAAAEHGTRPQPLRWLARRKGALTAPTHPHRHPLQLQAQKASGGQGVEPPTPGLYLCCNRILFLRFVPCWFWLCIWMSLNACRFQSHIWSVCALRSFCLMRVTMGSWMYTFFAHTVLFFLCYHFSSADGFVFSPSPQLFVIVVWNFELYMIPLALLLPLAWNYILIASGKDTRQDVVSRPHSFFSFHRKKPLAWQLRHHCFMIVLLVLYYIIH